MPKLSAKVISLVSLLAASQYLHAAPLGTAFTYQGQLVGTNGPASGSYDMVFALFDAPDFGSLAGSTLTHAIDGGGGTSAGGNYLIRGTMGQPDVGGPMANAQYSLTGGFWALPAVIQSTGTPTLVIAPAAPGFATLSWTPDTPGYILQETWTLDSANWTNSPSGTTNPVVVPAALPTKFCRLYFQP